MTESPTTGCGGTGLLYEPVSHPNIDHRDPRYEDREYKCPGCPDCDLSLALNRLRDDIRICSEAALTDWSPDDS